MEWNAWILATHRPDDMRMIALCQASIGEQYHKHQRRLDTSSIAHYTLLVEVRVDHLESSLSRGNPVLPTRATLVAFLFLSISTAIAADQPKTLAARPVIGFSQVQSDFKTPGMAYAPFIFWFWDEPLDPAKMAEMSRVMVSQGFNPGYAHARRSMVGTPDLPDDQWLTDPWFTAFDAALKEAKAGKGYLGFCDEYWWPSLQAHGRLVKQHPELQAQSLDWKVMDVAGGSTVQVPESYFASAAQLDSPISGTINTPPDFGKWIWDPQGGTTKHTCYLRKVFDLPEGRTAAHATIRVTADNGYKLSLNGKNIGNGKDWMTPNVYDIPRQMLARRNVLAVEANNIDGPCGMAFGMRVTLDDGTSFNVQSDGSWKTTLEKQSGGWENRSFNDKEWNSAREICKVGEGPWASNDITQPPLVHSTICSKTLQVIGAGKPFAWKSPAGKSWRVYVFNKYSRAGTDGGASNAIDERTGKTFVQMALEPYARRDGDALGKQICGDFIDNEGDYGWKLAWSDSLDRQYKTRYGRDIRLWMPLMLDRDVEGLYAKARWEWFDLVSDLYAANFRAITDWNEKHGSYTTAHFWEGSLAAQVNAVGDHLKLLRALSMPAEDCLGKAALNVRDFKEIESVAEFGNTRAATEFAGAGGWGAFTPEFLKQGANAITAWGMSHVIPHGVFTTRKLTGNKWMPDWYDENPIFPWMHLWTDFVRRASFINSLGHACPDVLLYNPLESAWALASADMFDGGLWDFSESASDGGRVRDINASYARAIQDLTDGRVEFLVGDRKYVGEMTASNGTLARGPLVFRTVVLPPLTIMPLDVARKLVIFARQGGRVYALGSLPGGSAENGMNDPQMAKLMQELASLPTFARCSDLKPLIAKDAPGLKSPIRFTGGAFSMLQSHRRIDGRDFFWLTNNSEKDSRACDVMVSGAHGAASIWDCETGKTMPIPSTDSADGSQVTLSFKPLEAYWLVFDPTRPASKSAVAETAEVVATIDGPWTVTYDPSAQPVMENPSKPGAEFAAGVTKPLEDWRAWGLDKFSGLLDYDTTVILKSAGGRMQLDLGTVHSAAKVWVNGKPCGMRLWAPYVFDISDAVREGSNHVRVRVGNLINNSYGDAMESGLRGPVKVISVTMR